jgi:hypothetical protein
MTSFQVRRKERCQKTALKQALKEGLEIDEIILTV